LFVNAAGGNYRLAATATQAIDKGDNDLAVDADKNPLTTDLDGNDRIFPVNGTVDIGAYEYNLSAVSEVKPKRPTGLKCTDQTNDSVTLAWDAATGMTGYDIRYRLSIGMWKTVSVTETWKTVSGLATPRLTAGMRYEFQVRAVNEHGESAWSESLFVTINQ